MTFTIVLKHPCVYCRMCCDVVCAGSNSGWKCSVWSANDAFQGSNELLLDGPKTIHFLLSHNLTVLML